MFSQFPLRLLSMEIFQVQRRRAGARFKACFSELYHGQSRRVSAIGADAEQTSKHQRGLWESAVPAVRRLPQTKPPPCGNGAPVRKAGYPSGHRSQAKTPLTNSAAHWAEGSFHLQHPIPHADMRLNVLRSARFLFNLLPERRHEYAQRSDVVVPTAAPYALHDKGMGQTLPTFWQRRQSSLNSMGVRCSSSPPRYAQPAP